jgi:hypothetical protein
VLRTPSAQTLDYQGVSKQLQELEEVSMTIVGGLDVHRKQITFDYVDTGTGEVRSGQIRPATRRTLRAWLGKHCPGGTQSSRWRVVPGGGLWSRS